MTYGVATERGLASSLTNMFVTIKFATNMFANA